MFTDFLPNSLEKQIRQVSNILNDEEIHFCEKKPWTRKKCFSLEFEIATGTISYCFCFYEYNIHFGNSYIFCLILLKMSNFKCINWWRNILLWKKNPEPERCFSLEVGRVTDVTQPVTVPSRNYNLLFRYV